MTGFVVLAAGASSRMGRPKQNLMYKGKALLQHAVDTALEAGDGPVVVVTGANASVLTPLKEHPRLSVVHNAAWENGMGGSIKTGLRYLIDMSPAVSAVLITLCDQPLVTSGFLKKVQKRYQDTGKGLIATSFNGVKGPPALFDRKYFANLLELSGAEGARKLFIQHKADLNSVNSIKGKMDVDTELDYLALISSDSVQ